MKQTFSCCGARPLFWVVTNKRPKLGRDKLDWCQVSLGDNQSAKRENKYTSQENDENLLWRGANDSLVAGGL